VLGWTSFSQIWQDAPTNTFFTAIPQTDCFLPTNFPEEPKNEILEEIKKVTLVTDTL
jgi:hypothetical protein